MGKAVFVRKHGGAEVLSYEDSPVGAPGPRQVLLRHTAIAVNYIDTYYRSGLYPAELPLVPGDTGAGVVEAVGAEVKEFKPGDRAACASVPLGAYAEERLVDSDAVVPLPEEISDELAGGSLTRGLTAEYLIHRLRPLKAGETILVHAAAGGTGKILCQWADKLGAKVIGSVGATNKLEIAKENGCAEALLHGEDFAPSVKELTGGRGVDVVYDSIGKSTFAKSLACLRPRGLMVSFGNASGKPPLLDVLELAKRGSLFLTRPTLYAYTAGRDQLRRAAERYFKAVAEGLLRVETGAPFALKDSAAAHRHLEDRSQQGSPVLLP